MSHGGQIGVTGTRSGMTDDQRVTRMGAGRRSWVSRWMVTRNLRAMRRLAGRRRREGVSASPLGSRRNWWSPRADSTNRDPLNNFCERRSRVLNSRFAALLNKIGVEFTTSGRCDASPLFSSPPLGVSSDPENGVVLARAAANPSMVRLFFRKGEAPPARHHSRAYRSDGRRGPRLAPRLFRRGRVLRNKPGAASRPEPA
jgi:hypothetical protein